MYVSYEADHNFDSQILNFVLYFYIIVQSSVVRISWED